MKVILQTKTHLWSLSVRDHTIDLRRCDSSTFMCSRFRRSSTVIDDMKGGDDGGGDKEKPMHPRQIVLITKHVDSQQLCVPRSGLLGGVQQKEEKKKKKKQSYHSKAPNTMAATMV